jgi:hypothetical protein
MRKYFESITDVCPFSLESFDAGRLPILNYSIALVELLYKDLKHYDAFLFKCHTSMDRDLLITTAHELHTPKRSGFGHIPKTVTSRPWSLLSLCRTRSTWLTLVKPLNYCVMAKTWLKDKIVSVKKRTSIGDSRLSHGAGNE